MMISINRLFFLFFTTLSAFFPFGASTYLVSFFGIKARLSIFQWLIIIVSVVFFTSKLMHSTNISVTIITFLLYFGFILFYPIAKSIRLYDVNLNYMFYFFTFIVLIEAFLVNSVFSATSFPNYPNVEGVVGQTHINVNGYQRPYSFGSNATVTSVILVALASMVNLRLLGFILLLICIIALESATGMLLFMIFVGFKIFYSLKYPLAKVFLVFVILSFFFATLYILDTIGARLNLEYILLLIDFKFEQVSTFFEGYTYIDYILGDISKLDSSIPNSYGYKGDFGWLEVLLGYGVLGLLIIASFILTQLNRHNCLPILILFIGTLHYGVIHTIVGQIILILAFFYKPLMGNDR